MSDSDVMANEEDENLINEFDALDCEADDSPETCMS